MCGSSTPNRSRMKGFCLTWRNRKCKAAAGLPWVTRVLGTESTNSETRERPDWEPCRRAWAASSERPCGHSPDWQVTWTAQGRVTASHIGSLVPLGGQRGTCFTRHVSAGAQGAVTRRGSWRTWRRSGPAAPRPGTSRAAAACCSQTALRCGALRGTHRGKSAGQSRLLCHF